MKEKRRNSIKDNCVTTASSCIKWTGPEIPCLDICYGDELDSFLHAIASKICAVTNITDFSNLSLQCLIDKLNVTIPTDRTLITLFQLAFDNDCKLKDLIDILEDKIVDPNAELNLNLQCLQVLDGFGNPIPVTQSSLNQTLITQFCIMKTDLLAIQASIIDLQNQIDAINTDPYVEPVISTCLQTSKSLTQQIILGFAQICAHMDAVGTVGEIQTAVASIGPDVQTDFIAEPGWQINQSTLAQSDTNQWIVINYLLEEIKILKDCACQFKCSDIKIGFILDYNDNNTVDISFTAGAGTFIPTGWTDNGTTLTITNQDDVSFGPILTPISQDGVVEGVSLLSFNPGDTLTFSFEVKLKKVGETGTLLCDKCYTQTVTYITSGCCVITNNSENTTTIIYKICKAG